MIGTLKPRRDLPPIGRPDIFAFPQVISRPVFADWAVVVKVLRKFKDHIFKLQLVGELLRDGFKAKGCAQNISSDRAGGVAVAIVIDGGNDALLEVIGILERTVDSDSPPGGTAPRR